MSGNPEYKIVEADSLHTHPDLTPPDDFVLSYLYDRALRGYVPVFQAILPFHLIRAFAPEFKPTHPAFVALVQDFTARAQNQQYFRMWVYPRGDEFVMSDDYAIFYAWEQLQPDFVPCSVIGDFDQSQARQVSGPLTKEEVHGAMFGVP